MSKFKDCRCGSRIPSEWPECQDCLVQGVMLKGDRRANRLRRHLLVKRRMATGSEMADVLKEHIADPKVQSSRILDTRAKKNKRIANRAAQALYDWYEGS